MKPSTSIDMTPNLDRRFWSKVNKRLFGCWVWKGYRTKQGYGSLKICRGNSPALAHRVSWVIAYGEIPKGLFALHKCDNPSCVRPSHLFLGTQLNNIQDARNKGRMFTKPDKINCQIAHPRKLVLAIRRKYSSGKFSQRSLARDYHVRIGTVSQIVNSR